MVRCKLLCYFYQICCEFLYLQISRRKRRHHSLNASCFGSSQQQSHINLHRTARLAPSAPKQNGELLSIFIKMHSAVLPTDSSSKTVSSFYERFEFHIIATNSNQQQSTLNLQPDKGRKNNTTAHHIPHEVIVFGPTMFSSHSLPGSFNANITPHRAPSSFSGPFNETFTEQRGVVSISAVCQGTDS